METEEKTEEVALSEESNDETVVSEETQEDTEDKSGDFRGKLNATNRFLEKEGYEFKEGKWLKPQVARKEPEVRSQDGLSNKDVIFLAKADIHEDDMDEVLDWAKFKKVPVSEAYKQLKTTLNVRAEERKSSEASNTGNSRRGSSQVDGNVLVERARAGKIPEGDADIQKLLKTKMGIKK